MGLRVSKSRRLKEKGITYMKYDIYFIDSQGILTQVAEVNNYDDARFLSQMFEWRDKIRYHGRKYDFRIKGAAL